MCQAPNYSRVGRRFVCLIFRRLLSSELGVALTVSGFGTLPTASRVKSCIVLFTTGFNQRAELLCFDSAATKTLHKLPGQQRDYAPLWGCPVSLLSDNRLMVVRRLLRVHKIPTGCCHPNESDSLNVFSPDVSDNHQRATKKSLGGPTDYSVRDSRETPSRRLGQGSGRSLTWRPSR